MDRFFDRVGDALRNLLGEQGAAGSRRASTPGQGDADFQEAWEELDGFLNDDTEKPQGDGDFANGAAGPGATTESVDPKLIRAYETLGIAIGTPFAEVRKRYKKLMQKHHPDRFAGDPTAQQGATARAAQINAAYELIQAHARGAPPT